MSKTERELKFRAYYPNREKRPAEVTKGFTFESAVERCALELFNNGVALMQFTGLLDKNGKEIYEGDIVLCEGDNREFEVCWYKWGWTIRHKDKDETEYHPMNLSPLYKVIGNVYEGTNS